MQDQCDLSCGLHLQRHTGGYLHVTDQPSRITNPHTCNFHSLFLVNNDLGISLGQHVFVCPRFVSSSTMAFSSLAFTVSSAIPLKYVFNSKCDNYSMNSSSEYQWGKLCELGILPVLALAIAMHGNDSRKEQLCMSWNCMLVCHPYYAHTSARCQMRYMIMRVDLK